MNGPPGVWGARPRAAAATRRVLTTGKAPPFRGAVSFRPHSAPSRDRQVLHRARSADENLRPSKV